MRRYTVSAVAIHLGLALAAESAVASPYDAKESAVVYCIDFQFLWNGNPVRAARRASYGAEVPNKRYPQGYEPSRTKAFALSPVPLLHLERLFRGRCLDLLTEPNLPLEPGELTVKISLKPCEDRSFTHARSLASTGADAARTVRFVEPVVEETATGSTIEEKQLAVAELRPGRSARYTFRFDKRVEQSNRSIVEREIVFERNGVETMTLEIIRPANQAWSFDWATAPEP